MTCCPSPWSGSTWAPAGTVAPRPSGVLGGRTSASITVAVPAGVSTYPCAPATAAATEVGTGTPLWAACLNQVRRSFDGLAAVRTPKADWDQLVLPEPQLKQLRALVAAARNRHIVLDEWGFADRTLRGLGRRPCSPVRAAPARPWRRRCWRTTWGSTSYRVDLSVVSKYIGETEKHLRRLFDAAEDGGVVLLFDEADALFGKRTEVQDSHDRYANLEVNYLLQRMESYRGLAILTTNACAALDVAFQRRLQTFVSFPYPDRAAREAMWRNGFPCGHSGSRPRPGAAPASTFPAAGSPRSRSRLPIWAGKARSPRTTSGWPPAGSSPSRGGPRRASLPG